MPTARVTKRAVDDLFCPPEKDRVILWDNSLSGFGVIAFRTGVKSYVIQYRQHGRSRRARIGLHGRLTADEARSEAKKLLGLTEGGHDPIATRNAAKKAPSFREASEDFMSLHVRPKRKPRTAVEYTTLLKKHILPALGPKRLKDIRRADISRLHASISKEAPFAANRALSLVSSIWNWAARRDLVAAHENPASGIEKNPEQGRERYLTSEEFLRLGDVLREAETVGLPFIVDRTKPTAKHARKADARRPIDPYAIAAIRLLIFTGARFREVLHMRWQEVDFGRSVVHLADSKTGRKPIILSAPALQLLDSLPRIEGNPFVFPGAKKDASRADLKKPWNAIRKAAGLEGVRLHDLRHTFASVGAGAALGLPVIGRLLGHSQPQTTARYAHLADDPLKRAADTIGATISAAFTREPAAQIKP